MSCLTRQEDVLQRIVQFRQSSWIDDALQQVINKPHSILRPEREGMLKEGITAHTWII